MQPWLLPVLAAPFVGSFLGVVIRRLPAGRPIALDRSRCETCGTPIAAVDLVPLASFAVLRGRCRACGAAIGWFHPAVEAAALAVAAIAACTDPQAAWDAASLWIDCALGWTLLALAWIDYGHMRLPDALTLPLLLAGLAVTALRAPDALTDHAAGAVCGYLAFRAIALAYRRLRGREGLGQGDAKLLAAAGAWLGVAALPSVVLGAGIAGLGGALLIALRRGRISPTTPIALGPCIALATWVVWLYVAGA